MLEIADSQHGRCTSPPPSEPSSSNVSLLPYVFTSPQEAAEAGLCALKGRQPWYILQRFHADPATFESQTQSCAIFRPGCSRNKSIPGSKCKTDRRL